MNERESADEFPADLLMGCIELGGFVRCESDRLQFVPVDREPIPVAYPEIEEIKLGGPLGADANRVDLRLTDQRTLTLFVVGRDRFAALVMTHLGWEVPDWKHGVDASGV